jgi:hypothetical protein
MQLPRFLWVPFEFGRPFGAPNEPAFQRRVLHAALTLLERDDGPVILEDFFEEAPAATTPADAEGWACPITFQPSTHDEPDLVRETLAEMAQLAPWHEVYVTQRVHSAPPACPMTHEEVVRGLGALAESTVEGTEQGEPAAEIATDLPLLEWVRLGCDDVRTWYLEAAQGQPGRADSPELYEWFWCQTAFARLIASAAMRFVGSPNGGHQIFGRRTMVPRAYMGQLMPGVEPSIGDLPRHVGAHAGSKA